MKRLISFTLIIIIALSSVNIDAKTKALRSSKIPFEKLVTMIATEAHWKERNVAKLGLKKLIKKTSREEYGTDIWFIYGKNVKATVKKSWTAGLTSTGSHAYAIEVALTTDNSTSLYFKEKADHDAFMSCARNSKYYDNSDGEHEYIGSAMISSEEYINGWYVISFHAG